MPHPVKFPIYRLPFLGNIDVMTCQANHPVMPEKNTKKNYLPITS
jgi:hypothetical protein